MQVIGEGKEMASYYSSVSSEGDMLPTGYFVNQKLSYPSSELPNNKEYEIQRSMSLAYPNFLSGIDHVEAESISSRDEMVFIPPTTNVATQMHQMDRELNMAPRYSDGNSVVADTHMFSKESMHIQSSEPIPDYHGLSLSLGSQGPSLLQLSSDMNQYTNSSFCSMLSSGMQSESQNNDLKNVQYLSFDLTGKNQENIVNYGPQDNLISSKMTSFAPPQHQVPEYARTFCNSKYLKAVQDLLDEVVNIHKVLRQSEKARNFNSLDQDGSSSGTDVKKDELQESTAKAPRDLLPTERHDLQDKITKLFSMLDEVSYLLFQYLCEFLSHLNMLLFYQFYSFLAYSVIKNFYIVCFLGDKN